MLIRMYQIEISKNDKLLKRFNWGGPELLTLSYIRCQKINKTYEKGTEVGLGFYACRVGVAALGGGSPF